MNKHRRKKLKWLRRLRQAAQDAFDEFGVWPARYKPHGFDEWIVAYNGGGVELLWRDRTGFIRGTGKHATDAACVAALFRQRVLDNRPPLDAGVSDRVRAHHEQGNFVVPAAIEEPTQ